MRNAHADDFIKALLNLLGIGAQVG